VLQVPTAEAACASVQLRDDDLVRLWSPCRDGSRTQLLSMRLADLGLPGAPISYEEARALFTADPRDRWAGYLLGGLLVLARERGISFERGAELLVHSDVPEGAGVGASAALAVASMQALAGAHGVQMDARDLALLCQTVENEVLGAPCGVPDQMTAACGEADEILALRCQPCEVVDTLPVPQDIEFVGVDSGVRHAAVRTDYGLVRAGAFVGARILAAARGLPVRHEGGRVVVDDPLWRGHLANCDPDEFRSRWRDELPETIGGAEFLQRYGGHVDRHTRIDPQRTYPVRAPTQHPIEENARAERFLHLLRQDLTPAVRRELGDLMFASHAAYSACGLGESATDFLVYQARQRRAAGAAIYGAKVTGGGSGGTVVLLGERGKVWYEALRIKKALLQATGHSAEIFRWSSPGAMAFGILRLAPKG
jgi:L-arabinokinase